MRFHSLDGWFVSAASTHVWMLGSFLVAIEGLQLQEIYSFPQLFFTLLRNRLLVSLCRTLLLSAPE